VTVIVSLSASGVAEFDGRRDARADPAFFGQFGFEQGGAQLDKRVAAKHRGEEEPVRFQRSAHLDQRAGQVGAPMQGETARDEIEARIAEWDQRRVGADARRRRRGDQLQRRVGGDHQAASPAPSEEARQRAVAGAKIEHRGEVAVDQVEPVDQPLGDFPMQEISAGGAVAMGAPGAAVEQRG